MMAMATLADLPMANSAAEPTTADSTTLPRPDDWKQQTVGDFFARCNWENLDVPPSLLEVDPAIAFDYNRSVGQFFGAIPWAGGAAVASASSVQEAVADATLPDVAQFGQGEPSIEELPDLEDIADESHLDGGDVTLDDFLGSFSLS